MLLFCCHSQAVSIAIYSLKSNLTVMSLVVINFSFTTVFMSSSVYDCMLKKALLPRNLHCFQIIIQRFISIISQRHHTLAYVLVGTKRPKPTYFRTRLVRSSAIHRTCTISMRPSPPFYTILNSRRLPQSTLNTFIASSSLRKL
jgi:hypothetical protein